MRVLCEHFGLRYWNIWGERDTRKKVWRATASDSSFFIYPLIYGLFAGIGLTPLTHTPSPTSCTLVDLNKIDRCNHCGFVLQHPHWLDDWNCTRTVGHSTYPLRSPRLKRGRALIGSWFPSFIKTTAGLSHGVIVCLEQNTPNRTTVISLPGVCTALSCVMFTMLRWAKVRFIFSIKLKLIDVISIIAFLFLR